MIGYRSFYAKPAIKDAAWVLIDAEGQTLGRLASMIAHRLRGKHLPTFTPGVNMGDVVVVINADKMVVTGGKELKKLYHRHTGYVGNLKTFTYRDMMARSPRKVLELAVKGMLPRGPLGRATLRKLKVYTGNDHPHTAQSPVPIAPAKIQPAA